MTFCCLQCWPGGAMTDLPLMLNESPSWASNGQVLHLLVEHVGDSSD